MAKFRPSRYALQMLKNRVLGSRTPFRVQINLLNTCNYRCVYCYADYPMRPGDELPTDKMFFIVDEAAKAGAMQIGLVGGEPLIRKDIDQIVDHIKDKGMLVSVTTNATLVRKKMDVMRKMDWIVVSLDGDEKANDPGRGAGTFKRTMDGVEALREAGIPVNFSTVLTKHSIHSIDFMVDLAKRCGGTADFTTLTSQEREGHQADRSLWPSREELNTALRTIIDLKRKGEPIGFSAVAYEKTLQWPDFSIDMYQGEGNNPSFNDVQCRAGRDFLIVDYNGDLYPCPQQLGLIKHGNVFRDGFQKAWDIAAGHDCHICPQTCTTDYSLFYSLRPSVVWNQFRNSRKHRNGSH